MRTKVIGFLLLSGAIVGVLVVVSFAEGYHPAGDLAWNLSNASVPIAQQTHECEPFGSVFARPAPNRPAECTYRQVRGAGYEMLVESYTTEFARVSLGVALAPLVALGFSGIGLMFFGERKGAT